MHDATPGKLPYTGIDRRTDARPAQYNTLLFPLNAANVKINAFIACQFVIKYVNVWHAICGQNYSMLSDIATYLLLILR